MGWVNRGSKREERGGGCGRENERERGQLVIQNVQHRTGAACSFFEQPLLNSSYSMSKQDFEFQQQCP